MSQENEPGKDLPQDEQGTSAEPVLSDEEKDALLDGIESGDVEVHSSKGPLYAEVRDFVISPRAHIISNSFPRLDLMNAQLSKLVSKSAEKLLGKKVKVMPGNIEQYEYGTLLEQQGSSLLIVSFTAAPLEGPAMVCFDAEIVAQLVECFYGGNSAHSSTQRDDFFTAGEKRVAQKFSESVLDGLGTSWEGLIGLKLEASGLHLSSDLIDGVEPSTDIIGSTFDMSIDDSGSQFRILWPIETIKGLLPALKDQKHETDPAQDAEWSSVIKATVTDSVVRISSQVGQTRMLLRDIAGLVPGDIIDIEDPRRSVLFARDVPVLEGQFGVHRGQYAIEATRWFAAGNTQKTH